VNRTTIDRLLNSMPIGRGADSYDTRVSIEPAKFNQGFDPSDHGRIDFEQNEIVLLTCIGFNTVRPVRGITDVFKPIEYSTKTMYLRNCY